MDMYEVNKALSHDGGGDPYQTPEILAAARRARAAEPAPKTEPAPPAKPTTWTRLAGVFAKKKSDARGRYLQLLKRVEIDDKELSDRELGELATAMDSAGVTEEQTAEHRDLIRRHREAKTAADRMPAIIAARNAAKVVVDEINLKIADMYVKGGKLAVTLEDAESEYRFGGLRAAPLGSLAEQMRELFGE